MFGEIPLCDDETEAGAEDQQQQIADAISKNSRKRGRGGLGFSAPEKPKPPPPSSSDGAAAAPPAPAAPPPPAAVALEIEGCGTFDDSNALWAAVKAIQERAPAVGGGAPLADGDLALARRLLDAHPQKKVISGNGVKTFAFGSHARCPGAKVRDASAEHSEAATSDPPRFESSLPLASALHKVRSCEAVACARALLPSRLCLAPCPHVGRSRSCRTCESASRRRHFLRLWICPRRA